MSHRIVGIIAVLTLLCGIVLHSSSAQEVPATVADSAEEITLLTGRGKDSVPGLYVYADGAFRVLNWATLYQVPNVNPGRIRIGGNVQQARLVHQVNPVPPSDAIKNHVQGTVQLHVVIDIEGNVKQVDVLSGPPDLTTTATDAVKQWRYQPTLLNGDPVEVDTIVSVSFAL